MRKVSVRRCPLSVRLSNACIVTKRKNDICVQIFIPHERAFSLVFWEEEWLVGATPSTWNCVSTGPDFSEIADFEPLVASGSAIVPSNKSSINTNRKSTTRFPVSLRWSSYVFPKLPKEAQKRKTVVFRLKAQFAWRKSATKFLCVETVSYVVIRRSLAYLSVQEWLVGEIPFTWKFGGYYPASLQIGDFQSVFDRSASVVTPNKKFN